MVADARLEQALRQLPRTAPFPCPYRSDRWAQYQELYWGARDGKMPGAAYQSLMDARFRRAGSLFYRPDCEHCQLCVPLRIPVEQFQPTRSQRRAWRRNSDVAVQWGTPEMTAEKFGLYTRYVTSRHFDGPMAEDAADEASLRSFLYDSPTETIEGTYRIGSRLVGFGICDVTPSALSTVYFCFDPAEERRSLGVYSTLAEIEQARATRRQYYYFGYWVSGCRKMEYKRLFGPH
jgi:arginine-tRNA-protein transferase